VRGQIFPWGEGERGRISIRCAAAKNEGRVLNELRLASISRREGSPIQDKVLKMGSGISLLETNEA